MSLSITSSVLDYRFEWSLEEVEFWTNEHMKMMRAPHDAGMKPVEFCKTRLGPQQYTWVGEFRFWVWEGVGWRLFVNNRKGMCFEVYDYVTREILPEIWNDFKKRLGV